MAKLTGWLKWLDNNLVRILLYIFFFFIPLYPKFRIHNINYTYVSIRPDDVFMAIFYLVFIVQLIRKKVIFKTTYLWLFIFFWLSAFLSFFYGYYIAKTMEIAHLGYLHAGRRVEYMFVFFIALSTIKNKKDFFKYLYAAILSLLLTLIYGIGQKFAGFPAVQTMNPEYSRGYWLFLTKEARVSSTFGGHYDFAAFIMFFIPMVLALYFYKNKKIFFALVILSLFLLTLTASRTAFIAFAISTPAFLIYLKRFKTLLVLIIITVILNLVSNTLVVRFANTFQMKQIFVNEKTGEVILPQKLNTALPAGTFYVEIKKSAPTATPTPTKITKNSGKTDKSGKTKPANTPVPTEPDPEYLMREEMLSEIRRNAIKNGQKLTASDEARIMATRTADLKQINTVASDISLATRLQVEWPRAIKAFLHNPILGTGPSSITEATDNDYLRWLGEFGLLGTIPFLIILFLIIKKIWLAGQKAVKNEKLLYYGFIFGMGALLIYASYIDIFEASKVAYIFWAIAGMYINLVDFSKE